MYTYIRERERERERLSRAPAVRLQPILCAPCPDNTCPPIDTLMRDRLLTPTPIPGDLLNSLNVL